MKKILAIALLFNCSIVTGQQKLNIVPMPVEVKIGKGDLVINSKTTISILPRKMGLEKLAAYLQHEIKNRTGLNLQIATDRNSQNKKSDIQLSLDLYKVKTGNPYELKISKDQVSIEGNQTENIFYGIQTFLQLIPLSVNSKQQANGEFNIPQLTISDHPRFEYRGMHLDVCRHFFPISFVKKYIDYLAAYKYNTFHWHLTEDQGWRIEIKKYPELTKTGAWRNGTLIGRYPGKGNDNKPYGGFYTQEQIKEVVQYAKERYIDVIPEIEMPGHSSAAIAAYPWLSCFPAKPTEIPAKMISQKSIDEQKAGRIKLVQETWGVFDDIFCAGKDSTFKFLENVIDEVVTLFPSKYFHMGGDEAPKAHWKKCPACQQRMKDNNLKDEHELQSWFVRRIEKYVNSKGKILIGWDEILEGGLAPNAVVMSWRGEKGGIDAAKQKHKVIMTPGNPVYFDHTQSNNEDSVTFGGYNPIENVYAYEPVPKELTAEEGKYILGAQANMWTEYQSNTHKIEYQMFPRMTALSEVLWSPKEKRNWKDFERRLPTVFERLNKQKINYSKAYYDLKATVIPIENGEGIKWNLESKIKDKEIYIALPGIFWPKGNVSKEDSIELMNVKSTSRFKYIEPFQITKQGFYKAMLDDTTDNITEFFLSEIEQKFFINKATGKKITIVTEADKKYPGDGVFTLVNGVQNEKGMAKSSEFLGFNGTDLDVTIDLGKEMDVSKVTVHVLKQEGSWIYLPSQVQVTFIPFIDTTIITKHSPLVTVTVDVKTDDDLDRIEINKERNCRYIRVRAKNYGIIPTGKPGGGHAAWLFVDEIEVQ